MKYMKSSEMLLLFIFQESCTNFPYILNIIMLFIHSTGFLREKGDRGLWHLNRHSLFKTKCPWKKGGASFWTVKKERGKKGKKTDG